MTAFIDKFQRLRITFRFPGVYADFNRYTFAVSQTAFRVVLAFVFRARLVNIQLRNRFAGRVVNDVFTAGCDFFPLPAMFPASFPGWFPA